jgi:predicted dehydrogenase
MKKVKWGIISTAKIGTEKVIPGMMKCGNAEVIAISSRNIEAAQKVAKKLGIKKAYGSYDALLEDPEIDAIYNPLPNHLHIPWTIKALQAGKHVLCEKPIALNAEEASLLFEAIARYPKLKLMEAFMYRHTPQWKFAKQKIADGSIGQLRNIHSIFSYFNADPNNIRNQSDIGGGGLMDIGCYCISLSRWLFGQEPARVSALMEFDPVMKTDRLASGMLDFTTGNSLFTCSTQMAPFQRATILCIEGVIEIEIPFNIQADQPSRLWMYTKQGKEEVMFDTTDQYTLQCESFSQSILEDAPVYTPIEDAVNNMKVIDAMFESATKNQWVELA